MTPEERQLLTGLFDRVRAAASNPRDREAEALIAEEVRNQPYAPYLLAQTVIVQEQALRAAADQLQQLRTRVQELESAQGTAQAQGGGSFLGGIGRSLFGGGEPSPPPAAPRAPMSPAWGNPQPQYAPPPAYAPPPSYAPPPYAQPSPWGQPSGSGSFLHGALGAAAGVAGGVLLANSLRGLFGGHNDGLGIGGVGGIGGLDRPTSETINNYYEPGSGAVSPDQQAQEDAEQDREQDRELDQNGGATPADYQDDGSSFDNGGNDDFNV